MGAQDRTNDPSRKSARKPERRSGANPPQGEGMDKDMQQEGGRSRGQRPRDDQQRSSGMREGERKGSENMNRGDADDMGEQDMRDGMDH